MARLRPADSTGEVADRVRQRRHGVLTPLDRVLLHSEPLADGWNTLLGAVRSQFQLPDELRELAILRVAVLNGADYEWQAHEPLLRQAGFSEDQVAALHEGADTSALSRVHQACLAYTDAMTRDVTVPDDVFAEVLGHLGERQTVELTATIATYNLVSRFLVAMEIGAADGEGTPA